MDNARWTQLERMLLAHSIRPIVAVVPDNQDPSLVRSSPDPHFWSHARRWQSHGWTIAQHGFQHTYTTSASGIVGIHSYSEFAGLPLEEQSKKILCGYSTLLAQDLSPVIWVAPGHSFDELTLQGLRAHTSIRAISDGIALHPFEAHGFSWIPQQLWQYRWFPGGIWTICLHPNDMNDSDLARFESVLARRRDQFVSVDEAMRRTRPRDSLDQVFAGSFAAWLQLRRALRRRSRLKA